MSNSNPAGKPAKTPHAASAKTTDYVCTNPDGVCDFNCCKCPYFVAESETVSMVPSEPEVPDWLPVIEYLICEDCDHVFKLPEGVEVEKIALDANCERCNGRVWGLTAGEFALSRMFGNSDEKEPEEPEADPCISPPNVSLIRFSSWEAVDKYITDLISLAWCIPFKFDIFRWKFEDSGHWYDELCAIPAGCWIHVEWGKVNV